MSKMHGKQEVAAGFDLNAFVGEAPGDKEASHPKSQTRPAPRQARKGEALTERVQIKITKAEMATLQEKTGLVPVSKWLRHELKERGII